MKAIAVFLAVALLAGSACADRKLLQNLPTLAAQAPGSTSDPPPQPPPSGNSPPPTVQAPPPQSGSSPPPPVQAQPPANTLSAPPPAPLYRCLCTEPDKSSGVELCYDYSDDRMTSVDCETPAGYSCTTIQSQPGQITPQAGPIYQCVSSSPSPPSPLPAAPKPSTPASIVPPTPAPKSSAPAPVLPPTLAPKPSAPAPVLPPTLAPKPSAPAPVRPPMPAPKPSPFTPILPPTPAPAPAAEKDCVCTPSAGPSGFAYCLVDVLTPEGQTTSTACMPPSGLQCTIIEAAAGQFAQIAGPVFRCGVSAPTPAPVPAPHLAPVPAPHLAPVPAPNHDSPTPAPGPNHHHHKAPPAPSTPVVPVTPSTPVTPSKPVTPSTPTNPSGPVTPSKPDTPSNPGTPSTPETPSTPANPSGPSGPAGPSDADVLNYLLSLATLEAEFYSFATSGAGLNASLAGNGPASTGGAQANITGDLLAIAEEFTGIDEYHVAYLRAALGSNAVDRPAINIGSAFSAAADMALATTVSPAFSPYADDISFLEGAFLFADLEVTAFMGAIKLLNNADIRNAITGMMATKAYQAAIIRDQLLEQKATVTAYGVNGTVLTQAFADLTNTLGNTAVNTGIAQTTDGVMTSASLIPADNYGIAFARNPEQVLNILYLGSTPGGFLPAGISGPLGTSTNAAVSG